jgi:anti-sigma regulatory factor (Ser/Thr protein kinase)
VSKALHDWDCIEMEDRAVLAVSEIVTNAVQHCRSATTLTICLDSGRVEVRVEDDADELPDLQPPKPDGESGRGLAIVAAVADHWGVEPLPDGGKAVYVAFDC